VEIAMVPIKEMSEMIMAASKYTALFTSILYTIINPITIEAIRSMAAIRSFTDGPLISRIKASINEARSKEKQIGARVFRSGIVLIRVQIF
jgi:hypothetical protein